VSSALSWCCNDNPEAKEALKTFSGKNPKECEELCKFANGKRLLLSENFIGEYSAASADGRKILLAKEALKQAGIPEDATMGNLAKICADDLNDFETLYEALKNWCLSGGKPSSKSGSTAKDALAKLFLQDHGKCVELCRWAKDKSLLMSESLINLCAGAEKIECQRYVEAAKNLQEAGTSGIKITVELVNLCTGEMSRPYLDAVQTLVHAEVDGHMITVEMVKQLKNHPENSQKVRAYVNRCKSCRQHIAAEEILARINAPRVG
jgi:hypothetical protein